MDLNLANYYAFVYELPAYLITAFSSISSIAIAIRRGSMLDYT
jgi:hypothetical protein